VEAPSAQSSGVRRPRGQPSSSPPPSPRRSRRRVAATGEHTAAAAAQGTQGERSPAWGRSFPHLDAHAEDQPQRGQRGSADRRCHDDTVPSRSRAELIARLRLGTQTAPMGAPAAAAATRPWVYSAAADEQTAASGIRRPGEGREISPRAEGRRCTASATGYSAAAAAVAAACDQRHAIDSAASFRETHSVPLLVPAEVGECGRTQTSAGGTAAGQPRRRLKGKQTPPCLADAKRCDRGTTASEQKGRDTSEPAADTQRPTPSPAAHSEAAADQPHERAR
jgi:hypothetical protein